MPNSIGSTPRALNSGLKGRCGFIRGIPFLDGLELTKHCPVVEVYDTTATGRRRGQHRRHGTADGLLQSERSRAVFVARAGTSAERFAVDG